MPPPRPLPENPTTHPRNPPPLHEHNLPPLARHSTQHLHPARHNRASRPTNGYHRDGSHFPRLSPYEIELRRRKWAIISLWDRVTSVQVGLPSMIKAGQCDTREPASLLDTDIDEDVTEIPKERPENEHTHIQFLVVKNRLMDVFSEICELTTRIQPSTYTEILALDSLLSKAYSSIPVTADYLT
ncbi:hypothetical protein DL98DRAFT_631819 [Cadophora sp. DSE1049]|nr:hypothetical protein DL98DRAFT_631819 [Cadophora sp. DSE1049]